MRTATVERKTNETDISIEINLDGSGKADSQTGLGFFDHMLTQVAVHGVFDLRVRAVGDLDIDPHHTVEDVGLVLGQACNRALGAKHGLVRTATATVPMDEALAQAVIDLSGRPFFVCRVSWSSPMVGNLPTTLVEHFFGSFANACAANVHLLVHYGSDNHHISEALFKSFGRALSGAVYMDPQRSGKIPSSKGTL